MASNYEKRKVEIITNAQQSEASINTLRTAARLLQNEMNKLERGSKEFKEAMDKWKNVDARFKSAQAEVRGLDNEMGKLSRSTGGFMSQLKNIAGGVMVGNFFSFLGSQISGSINSMIAGRKKISDEMADIAKTTNMSAAEVRQLDAELGKLDTRTSKSGLRELAVQAGKLGKTGVEDVRKFVEEMNQIQVALGEDLGEEAILQIGKMTNVYEAGAMNIASAVNAIGASSEASEQYLVDFSARLGGAARTAKISAPDIIGYGAVLDQMGLQVEMSSTALSNFIIDFVKDTAKFEKAAGMQAGSLKKIIGEEGTNEGLLAFIKNLKESTNGQDEFLQKLEDVGIDGSRGAAVFLTLSNNLEEVTKQQALANKEFDKATSITDEYNKKNENFAAQLEKLSKRLYEIFVDSSIMRGVEKLVGWLYEMTKIPVSESMEDERVGLQELESQLFDTNTKHEDRVKIIKNLQDKYPKYFGHLNAEKAGYNEIKDALERVNKAMIDKIILQRKLEEVDKSAENAAEVKAKLIEAKADLNKAFKAAKAKYPQYDSELMGGSDYVARSRILVNNADSDQTKFLGLGLVGLPQEIGNLETKLNYVYKLEEQLKSATKAFVNLKDESQKLRKELGLDEEAAKTNTPVSSNNNLNLILDPEPDKTVEKHKKALKEKVFDEQAALREVFKMTVDNLEAWRDMEETIVQENYANGIISKEEQIAKLDEIELNHLYALRDTYVGYGEAVEAIDLRIANHKVAMMEKVKKAEVKMAKQYDKRPDNFLLGAAGPTSQDGDKPQKASWDKYAEGQLAIYRGIIDIATAREEAELQADRNILQSRLDSLEAAKRDGLITEEQFLAKKEAMEKAYNDKVRTIKRQQWERERIASITQAIINTAVSVTATLANPVLAAIVGAAGALQVAAIAAQPIPEFAAGGSTLEITGKSGRRYNARRGAASGYYNSPTYIVGEAGGEYVVPSWLYNHPSAVNMMQALEATVANKDTRYLQGAGGGAELGPLLMKLSQQLDQGITARVPWDQKGYEKYLETWNTAEKLSRF